MGNLSSSEDDRRITTGQPTGNPSGNLGETFDGGVTIAEAARYFSVSEKVIRTRLNNRELEGWKVSTRHGHQWRVRLPGGEPSGASGETLSGEVVNLEAGTENLRESFGQPSALEPLVNRIAELEHLLINASHRNGWLEAQTEQVKALKATEEELRTKAAQQEERARLEAEARRLAEQKANEESAAKRRLEEENERLRRELNATQGALEAEQGKGFIRRLLGR
jgi:hypothetical protein